MSEILHPSTLVEAARLLRERPGARLLAGGTDALLQVRKRPPAPPAWVDLGRVGGDARAIRVTSGVIHLGALVTFDDLAGDPAVRRFLTALHQAASVMGSRQIRARGTLGGNLAHASPAGDSIPPLLVAEARVLLLSASGTREVPLDAFFRGPGATVLAPDEILAGVVAPADDGRTSGFHRVGSRVHHVITKVSLALSFRRDGDVLRDVRVALGAVAPTVFRARGAEAALEGRVPTPDRIREAGEAAAAEARPIDDVRSTRAYRAAVCAELVGVVLELCDAPVPDPVPS